ncbi:restriction endonuclease subunit S [Streptomyces sp900129855]|uniref:Restriction endonuclease subunit S n=1 Tax=Streptomyces sp. 900129855 TaxID=3155129 RepID=A0ABV2ZCJ8_9ACTN
MVSVGGERVLPAGWAWAELGDVVEVLDRQRIPVSAKERSRRPGNVPYYGASGQVGWIDEALFDEDLVLLGEDGVQFFDRFKAKAYRISGKSWVNNHAHVLRVQAPVADWRYICHYLNSFNYEGYANGTTRLKLTKSAMVSIPIALPPLEEQYRIVEALEEQLSRLDQAKASVSMAQIRADSLTDVLVERAVRGSVGELERHGLGASLDEIRAATRGKAGKRWKPTSPVRLPEMEVPEQWTLVSLGDLSWDHGYGTSMKCEYGGAGAAVLRIPNVQRGFIDIGDIKHALDADADLAEFYVQTGDILFVRTNGSPALIGRAGVVERDMEVAFASYLIRFRINTEFVDPWWVQLVTRSRTWRRHIERIAASSAGQYNLNAKRLAELPIPLPALSVQREVLDRLNSELSWIGRLQSVTENVFRRSERLRARILDEAFYGRLSRQDPADESATALLARFAEIRAAQPKLVRSRRGDSRVTADRAARTPTPRAAEPEAPAPEPTPAPALAVQQEFDL